MTGRPLPFAAASLCLALTVPAALMAAPLGAAVDPSLLAGLRARAIGPAVMSGRVAAVGSVASNPDLIYVGAATGGVWKTTNGGTTWQPIFDDQPVAAIGALAIDPNNPDVVWVGTGEGNVRNSASVGDGVYKTLDGGRTWQHLGLEKSERIPRLVLDPRDSRVAYAAAMGRAWGENPERGVYKTTDGGKSWKRILYVDERTGAAEIVMDPSNPNKLFAAMWDYRRWPWVFRSGGPGSGLYVTQDGGETWRKATPEDGLPEGDLGRIGLAVAPSDPRVVYALIEAEKSALARSADGGRTWSLVNTDPNVSPRPFYYSDIHVDPQNPNRIYRLGSLIHVSNDGGRSFQVLVGFNEVHPDHHAFWIDPKDGNHLINGNDGGVAISRDRGETWQYITNLPLAQFYHVRVDQAVPYNIYGGLQDNGSWKGPGAVWENGGIRNHHWQEVMFGDGFDTVPDPRDSLRGYAMAQEGFLARYDLKTGERRDIRPASPDPAVPLRFNWNAGIAIDPFEPETLYFGSQYVHKTTDGGRSWTVISPDLTTNRKDWQKKDESGGLTLDISGAESYTTILAIQPSSLARGVLWAGTDDGRLHVTRDGGKTWDSVEKNLRGVPANTWIPHIEASPHDAGTAFVVLDDHRRSNWTPYVYKTADYGKTWQSLATNDLRGYALAIVQDPVDPDLLFLGTEFGLWLSLDGGKSWMRWKHGVPTVSVMDLAIHPREHDLVVATHGRALYVIDDIRPLQTVSDETQKKPVHLYDIADAQQYRVSQTGGSRFAGDTEFRGENEPYGALITYSLNAAGLPHPDREKERDAKEAGRAEARRKKDQERAAAAKPESTQPLEGESKPEEVLEEEPAPRPGQPRGPQAEIQILDGNGKVIRTFRQPAVQGVNRAVWDLRRDAFKQPSGDDDFADFFGGGGPEVLPGTYTVRVKHGKEQAEAQVKVAADPRFGFAPSAREANFAAVYKVGALQEAMAAAVERVVKTRTDVDTVIAKARAGEERDKSAGVTEENKPRKDLLAAARRLRQGIDRLEKKLWDPPKTKGMTADTDLQSRLTSISGSLSSTWDAPTPAQQALLDRAEALTREVLEEVNRFFAEDVAAFRTKMREQQVELLPEWEPLKIQNP